MSLSVTLQQKSYCMKKKSIMLLVAAFSLGGTASAQNAEPADTVARQLPEVVITPDMPATRLEGSTLVSVISGSVLKDAGNALDVLAQLPMITVKDKSVEITGRSNVRIFIDGRPLHDEDELRMLRSQDMKKVELLMTPGAAYESNVGAVLKITTKKRFIKGLSATSGADAERRRRWSSMEHITAGYHTGAGELFFSSSFNHSASLIKGSTVSSLRHEGQPVQTGSTQNNGHTANVCTAKVGFNHSENTLSFGAYYRINPEHGNMANDGTEWTGASDWTERHISRRTSAVSHLVSAYFDDTFSGKYHLHFDGNFRRSSSGSDVCTAYPHPQIAAVGSSEDRRNTLWAGKLYADFPLLKGSMTAGVQSSYTHTSLDYEMLNPDVASYIPSYVSDARQTSAALFAAWSRTVGRLSLSVGARYEFTDYVFCRDGIRDNDICRRDNAVTPDISLGYMISSRSQISLSYKTSTVKPPYSQLTGSLNYVGRHEVEGGNTGLRDERLHNICLSGTLYDFMFQADFSRSTDTYAFVKQPCPQQDLMLVLHPVNIDVSALSIYLMWNKTVKCWKPGVTLGMYRQWLTMEGTRYAKPIFSYYWDNAVSLPHNFLITADVSGQTCGDMHTNRFAPTPFTVNVAVSKTFMKKSLTLRLAATDVFNTACYDWTMNTFGVFVDKRQTYDRRGVSLSVSYRFRPRKSGYKGGMAAEDEMKRL